jgi:hypothetical protein
MEILIGDDVMCDADMCQPINDTEIGVELAQVRALLAIARPLKLELGAHVEDRPQPRGMADARAIAMRVVE